MLHIAELQSGLAAVVTSEAMACQGAAAVWCKQHGHARRVSASMPGIANDKAVSFTSQ
jgi:hypothetical protein